VKLEDIGFLEVIEERAKTIAPGKMRDMLGLLGTE
jgi:hypothetical protein